jgi:hypothetical protein
MAGSVPDRDLCGYDDAVADNDESEWSQNMPSQDSFTKRSLVFSGLLRHSHCRFSSVGATQLLHHLYCFTMVPLTKIGVD